MYMYIYIYVCIYIYMYTYIHIFIFVYMMCKPRTSSWAASLKAPFISFFLSWAAKTHLDH